MNGSLICGKKYTFNYAKDQNMLSIVKKYLYIILNP